MRASTIKRTTAETDINLSLVLDGSGKAEINSGCGFLDHMLTLFARHSHFDLTLDCRGDVNVDYHHTVEDIAICIGRAFAEALGDKRGIRRYGDITLPMDESLILAAVDISGRSCLCYNITPTSEQVGTFDTQLIEEFWLSFVRNSGCTLHLKQLAGSNCHHILEGVFKAAAYALRAAVSIDGGFADEIPSTKGVL